MNARTVATQPAETRAVVSPAVMSDASLVVGWLNHSSGSSREHVLAIYREMLAIKNDFSRLVELRATSPAFKSKVVPDAEWTEKYRHEFQRLERRTKRIDRTLARLYSFHPAIGGTLITETRSAGLVPHMRKRDRKVRIPFETTRVTGVWELVEADAVLALTRLYLSGELERIALCEHCRSRWFAKAKSHFRFCSDSCREKFYAKSPTYHPRKAATQRRYRLRRKQAEARGLA